MLSRRFLPALASGVIDAMDAAPPGSEQQMAALRVYRMLEDRQSRRPEWVEDWMARQWQQKFPGQGQLQGDLMRHLQYALAYADTDLPQYRQRIAEVQQVLRKVPLPERVYASLKQQAGEQLNAGLDLRHQVGPAFDVVYHSSPGFRQGEGVLIAPMLTAKGFKEYFEPRSQRFADMAMIDQWALGERGQLDYSDADREALGERLRNLYSADFIDSWRRALNAFSVADFRDLDHGVAILGQLTGPAAPLHRLLDTVRDNTSLSSAVVAEAPGEVEALRPTSGRPDQQQAWAIQRAFAGLSAMLQATGEKPSYYDETLGAIAAVHDYAKAVQDSPDRGKAALQAVHQRFSMTGQDPIGTLQRVATGLPEPINQQVRKMADQAAQVLNVEALRELERRWDAEVYSFFQQRLAGRYPFVVKAPDASLDDFEAFFGPKGRLQQFHDQYLKVFLRDNLEALQAGQQGQSLIRSDVLEQLERADRIRETFFDQRGNLSVQFSIEPLGLSANQRTSLLDLDGQLIPYTHGPSQITGIVWPNTLGQQVRSNLTLLRQNGNSSSLEYAVNFIAMLFQLMNHHAGLLHFAGEAINVLAGLLDQLVAAVGFLVGQVRGAGGELSVARHFLHTAGHLGYCAGNLGSFPLLAEGRAIVVVHCRQKLFGFLAQLAGRIGNASDYCPGLGFEHLQGEIDLAKLVAAAAVENLAQRIVGDIPGFSGKGVEGAQAEAQHAAKQQAR